VRPAGPVDAGHGAAHVIVFHAVPLSAGVHAGTVGTDAGGVAIRAPVGVLPYLDPYARDPAVRHFAYARWTGPPVEPGFVFTELVPTWHARTPGPTWIQVAGRVRDPVRQEWSPWLTLARWAERDTTVHPTSVAGQAGGSCLVDTDVLRCRAGADAWQLRVDLLRAETADASPVLEYVAAVVSRLVPRTRTGTVTTPDPEPDPDVGPARVLDVPALSQQVHSGHYPRWGGGGATWCSPTSTAMVLTYWGGGPGPDELSWVDGRYPDRPVYHAVRHCWDYAFAGGGNWSFNVAYAARFGHRGFVTRLRDLGEAARFIAVGIPLIASVRVDPDRLTGAGYESDGHLLVIAGFTAAGDVVVNDPAAADPATVRRVYHRHQFTSAWLAGSGGLVYVIHPASVALPHRTPRPNW
jgi:hypothetical protein